MSTIGVVVIGRNEGERLCRCLDSLRGEAAVPVYVDSGSTDGSVRAAKARGAEVVELDESVAFTAARARNAGFRHLREIGPAEFVQFVDGDCELREGWLRRAAEALRAEPRLAIVCGRLRERRPEASIYNRLCDMEWDGPIGDVESCGGVFMARTAAIEALGGFDASLIAGEEPDLCARLRRAGWRVRRIAAEMALHDAAMTRFGQWWKRAVRSGHAAAEGAWRHARHGERRDLRRIASAILWTAGLPLIAALVAVLGHPAGLAILLLYPVQWLRVRARRRRTRSPRDANLLATFTFIGKCAELWGACRYAVDRFTGRPSRIIEHRGNARREQLPRLLYLSGTLPSRSETFVYREVLALHCGGLEVHIASVHAPDRDLGDVELDALADEVIPVYARGGAALLADAGIECVAHPICSIHTLAMIAYDVLTGKDVPVRRRPRLAWQGLAGLALARRVRGRGITHVHSHMAHVPTSIAMYAARQLAAPFSFTGHAVDLFAQRTLLRRKLARAAFVACISRWHRELYQSICRRTPESYPIVRCGVDVSEFQPRPRDSEATPMILSVARLVPKKGLDLLIQALTALRRNGREFEAVIVGDGPQRERLHAMTAQSDLIGCVSFRGALPNSEIRQLLCRADLFVLPCRTDEQGDRDGIPVALMEAMACGVPVISGDLPAIRELVIQNETGVLVNAPSPEGIARAICELLDDEARRERISRAGRARVCEEFSQHVNIERLCRAFGVPRGGRSEARSVQGEELGSVRHHLALPR